MVVVGTSQQEVHGLDVSVRFLCGVWGESVPHTTRRAPSQLYNFTCLHVWGETCNVPNCHDDAVARRKKKCSHRQKKTPEATQSSHFISWLVYLSLAMTPCTLLFILLFFFLTRYCRRCIFFFGIVNSENDKMHFRKLLIQAVYDQGEGSRSDPLLFTFFFFFFLNNTCHLIVLSLWYLHRYSRLSFIADRDLLGLFFCLFFLMCYHILFLKNYIYNHNKPRLPAAGDKNTQLESLALELIKLLMLKCCHFFKSTL